MRISNCFKKVVAMAMLGVMVATSFVMTKTDDLKAASIHVGNIKNLMECQVYDYQVDSFYGNKVIRSYAKNYINEGFIILDERRMVEKFNTGLAIGNGGLFKEGFRAIDSYEYPSKEIYICKCTQSEFNTFVRSLPSSYKRSSDICYTCYWNNGDYSSVVYDSRNEIIEFSYYSLVY